MVANPPLPRRAVFNRFAPSDVFEVIKQLPGSSEPEYRIKSVNEPHEPAACDSELIKAKSDGPDAFRKYASSASAAQSSEQKWWPLDAR